MKRLERESALHIRIETQDHALCGRKNLKYAPLVFILDEIARFRVNGHTGQFPSEYCKVCVKSFWAGL